MRCWFCASVHVWRRTCTKADRGSCDTRVFAAEANTVMLADNILTTPATECAIDSLLRKKRHKAADMASICGRMAGAVRDVKAAKLSMKTDVDHKRRGEVSNGQAILQSALDQPAIVRVRAGRRDWRVELSPNGRRVIFVVVITSFELARLTTAGLVFVL